MLAFFLFDDEDSPLAQSDYVGRRPVVLNPVSFEAGDQLAPFVLHRLGLEDRLARHDLFPVNKITILDQQGDGRTKRLAVSDAGKNLHFILFDLHPAAAAIALLSTPEFVIDGVDIDR